MGHRLSHAGACDSAEFRVNTTNAVPTVAAGRFVPCGADCRQLCGPHIHFFGYGGTVVSADVVVQDLFVAATMYIAY